MNTVMTFLINIKRAGIAWNNDRCPQMAAATAYYAMFSLAPLLLIALSIAGFLFGQDDVRLYIQDELTNLIGTQGTQGLMQIADASQVSQQAGWASVIGIILLLLGASWLFAALQDSLNQIWRVTQKHDTSSIMVLLRQRILSLGLVLSIGFLLLISLVLSAIVNSIGDIIASYDALAWTLPLSNQVLSLLIITLLFALLFKYLPDVYVPWNSVWMGSFVTAVLFTIGKSIIGWYLGQSAVTSAYGAAGSLVVLLIWINYSAQIFFFGAEYVRERALQRNKEILPKSYATFKGKLPSSSKPGFLRRTQIILGFLALEGSVAWKVWRWYRRRKR